MKTRTATTIRLSDDERKEIEATMKQRGYTQLAPFIRFAIHKLKDADSQKVN